jgi:hypothetical protein
MIDYDKVTVDKRRHRVYTCNIHFNRGKLYGNYYKTVTDSAGQGYFTST